MVIVEEKDDRFYLGDSTIPRAGRGLFARRLVRQGEYIDVTGVMMPRAGMADRCTSYGWNYKFLRAVQKLKKPLAAGAIAASLLGGTGETPWGAQHLRDPEPVSWMTQADYLAAQDAQADKNDAEDLARIEKGLDPVDRIKGGETLVTAKDSMVDKTEIDGDKAVSDTGMPGSDNFVGSSNKNDGTRVLWPQGVGQKGKFLATSDLVPKTTQWHSFGIRDQEDQRKSAEKQGLDNVVRHFRQQDPRFPLPQNANVQGRNVRAMPFSQWMQQQYQE